MNVHKNIALSFNTAEYYSMQEASEYLNTKYNVDNITPKKILKRIYEFDVDSYFYGKGFYLLGTHSISDLDDLDDLDNLDNLDNLNNLDDLDEGSENLQDYINKIDSYLIFCDFMPSMHCIGNGLFMKLNKRMIGQLVFSNRIEVSDEWADLEGLLPQDRLDANPNDTEEFLTPNFIPRNNRDDGYKFNKIKVERSTFLPILPKEYIDDIGLQKALKRINLTVLEHYHFKDYQIESYEGSNIIYSNKDTIVLNLEVTNEDVLILHKDLEKLEKHIIDYQQPIDEISEFKRKGVSPKLLKAKLVANAHAQYLWSKDYDKKIRIGEMCELIWSYLIDTEHSEMLPERKATLKKWLSLIPDYASEAGRPNEK
ncbi:hypothetical protein IP510_09095 [Psychrobacter sp. NG254]|uniref:hypothetical protein n=1 Tax=Psychrobacter sp. NG254 TaxID=2782003 RepID=UPI0018887949|nr:hypothetical protein [Psychrobacter sp. NG254]MBF2720034.1 hypothetical protein [Psychrobacter sp. NG254]